jgi:hypothetical protein
MDLTPQATATLQEIMDYQERHENMARLNVSNFSFLARRRSFLVGLLVAPTAVTASAASPEVGGASAAADDIPLYKRQFSAFQNKTLEQKIQELADREEIRELISRYAHCVAHGVSVADMFTDDGAFILRIPGRPAQETRGRDQLVKHLAPTGSVHPLPMIHNYLLAISGDGATGMCSNELRITENGQSIIASGYYQDKLRRENGRWKFVVRDAIFIHWVPIQRGWASSGEPQ